VTEKVEYQYSSVDYSPGQIAALRDLFIGLSKGIRASRQYPHQHPIPSQFRALFFDKLKNFFESGDALAVKVTHDTLWVGEEAVYKGSVAPENIAHLLHRSGVRFLEMTPYVTSDEAAAFFEAFVFCSSRDDHVEDIVNLFWQAGFENIRYDVIDVFEVAEMKDLREEFDSTRSPADDVASLPIDNDAPLPLLPHAVAESHAEKANCSPEELQALHLMVENDRTLDVKNVVIELLLLLCESELSAQDLALSIEALQSTFDRMIHDLSFDTLTHILCRVRELLGPGRIESPATRKKLTEFVARCGDSLRIKMITEALNRQESVDLEPARRYLNELTWESFNNFLWMLGELASYPARKMVCDLLVEKGLDRIDILGSAVFDSRWYLVRNVVWVLGETGNGRALNFLRRVAAHPDIRVRMEVVKALTKIDDPEKVDLLLALLQDDEVKVRIMAAEALGDCKSDRAYSGLRKIVLAKDFLDAPAAEMRKVVEAMLVAGGAKAVETVREMLARSPFFNRAPLRRLQDALLLGLRRSPATEAVELLAKLSADSKSRYSQPAQRVLALRESRTEGVADAEPE
jgi:hypothetical protein